MKRLAFFSGMLYGRHSVRGGLNFRPFTHETIQRIIAQAKEEKNPELAFLLEKLKEELKTDEQGLASDFLSGRAFRIVNKDKIVVVSCFQEDFEDSLDLSVDYWIADVLHLYIAKLDDVYIFVSTKIPLENVYEVLFDAHFIIRNDERELIKQEILATF